MVNFHTTNPVVVTQVADPNIICNTDEVVTAVENISLTIPEGTTINVDNTDVINAIESAQDYHNYDNTNTKSATTPISATRIMGLHPAHGGVSDDYHTIRCNDNGHMFVSIQETDVTQPVSGTVSVDNFPATQTVSGSVSVSNLPATQTVDGTVNVGNLPATQTVDGTVNVGNFPATQAVSGTVAVSNTGFDVNNFPATQAVSGTVAVSNSGFDVNNFPATQTVDGSVNVGNFPASQTVDGSVVVQGNDGTTDQTIKTNSSGQVEIGNFPSSQTVSGTVAVSNTGFDVNNFPSTQTVDGTVNVGNFPATQAVSGSVSVSNLPATQTVDGTVNVGNFPASQTVDGSVVVKGNDGTTDQTIKTNSSGQVEIGNFPSSQTVSGTVAVSNTSFDVGNFPATQAVSGTVAVSNTGFNVNNFPATQAVSGTVAVSNTSFDVGNFPASQTVDGDVNATLKAKYTTSGDTELTCTQTGALKVDTGLSSLGTTTSEMYAWDTSAGGGSGAWDKVELYTGGSDKAIFVKPPDSQGYRVQGYDSVNTTYRNISVDANGQQNVTGSVSVSNFPATQAVSGTVAVSNTGFDVNNFPATQTVDGTVNVGNFPATQPVSGSVSVSNFPATQPVSGTITANAGTGTFSTSDSTAQGHLSTIATNTQKTLRQYRAEGKCFSAYTRGFTATTNYVYSVLYNPVASGKTLYVFQITVGSNSDTNIFIGSATYTSGGTAKNIVNMKLGNSTTSVATLRSAENSTITVSNKLDFDYYRIGGGTTIKIDYQENFIEIPEGQGLYFENGTSGVVCSANYKWFEE